MNYIKVYDDLVAKCIVRGLDKKVLNGYFEKHHIIPKCLGGKNTNDNYVLFTAREHVIAHKLLWKAYPDNYSLMWAYTRTVNAHKDLLTWSDVEKAKIAKAKFMSERIITQETKDKISATLTGHKRTEESIEKGRKKQIGQKRSAETSKKLSEKRQQIIADGWTLSDDARKKIGDAARGRKRSPEAIEKSRQAQIGKILSEEQKAQISEYQKSLRPWQKSCMSRPERARVWAMAANYYNIWVENNKPGHYSFATICSKFENLEYKKYHFTTLVEMFHEDWIPHYDKEWLEFHSEGT